MTTYDALILVAFVDENECSRYVIGRRIQLPFLPVEGLWIVFPDPVGLVKVVSVHWIFAKEYFSLGGWTSWGDVKRKRNGEVDSQAYLQAGWDDMSSS